MKKLKVVYLLPDVPLFGGVKVVLQHADLLINRGHNVSISGPGKSPDWRSCQAEFVSHENSEASLRQADIVIATYWTTLVHDIGSAANNLVHFCQGYEGSFTHNVDNHADIVEVYKRDIPVITVSDHLKSFLQKKFSKKRVFVTPPVLDDDWHMSYRVRMSDPPRIFIAGPWEIDWKGVRTGLSATLELLRRGVKCKVVRLSQWPLCEEEKNFGIASEYHECLPPHKVPDLIRSCDLALCPSWEQEGFGLPALEAMASGVPVVASDISSFKGFASNVAMFAQRYSPDSFAEAMEHVISNSFARSIMRLKGIYAARKFRSKHVGDMVENALYSILE